MPNTGNIEPEIALRMHDPRVADARGRMLQLEGIDERELGQIIRVMDAMFRWREAEKRVTIASQRFMQLGETDMKALRLAIIQADQGQLVTAKDITDHLGITSAATTKLLDRLESAGHITRSPHPTDRRSITVGVNPETRTSAELTVGREHARRFRVAAALSPEDRETVIDFLSALADTSEDDWAQPGAPPSR